jgi:CRISPR-associated protein Cas1
MRREIPVSRYSGSGWFLGHTVGTGHRNVELRTAQYRESFDPAFCFRLARGLVASKLRNCRTLLRRNTRENTSLEASLGGLRRAVRAVGEVKTLGELLGVEGNGAAIYFAGFSAMLRGNGAELPHFFGEFRELAAFVVSQRDRIRLEETGELIAKTLARPARRERHCR